MNRLLEIRYCSLFSYCPRSSSEKGELAKKVMKAIKNELPVKSKLGEMFASEFVVETLKETIRDDSDFREFIGRNPILIPVPRHFPIKRDYLWPSFQIAKAMEKENLGVVKPLLERIKVVSRSSLSPPGSRPSPITHYRSMTIKRVSLMSQEIILVDDIITRGHTFIASAWYIHEVFPDAQVKAFAAMRTISNESEFKRLIDPVIGKIKYRPIYDDCLRRP